MPKTNLEVITVKEFALRVGVTSPAIVRHIETGRITSRSIQYSKGGKPKLIADLAMEDLKNNVDVNKVRQTRTGLSVAGLAAPKIKTSGGTSRGTKKSKPSAKDVAEKVLATQGDAIHKKGKITTTEGFELDFSRDPASLNEARIREAIAKAVNAELDVDIKKKTLVDVHKQDLQLAALGANLKKDISVVADRLAAPCAAESDVPTVRNIIHAELEAILLKHSGPRKVFR